MQGSGHDYGPRSAELVGRVAVVTGGASGIGAGCARVLVEAGARVVILDRDEPGATNLARSLSAVRADACTSRTVDVGDLATLATTITSVAEAEGRLDVLVNNAAMFPGWSPLEAIDDALVMEALRVNVAAYITGSRAAAPFLRAGRGAIVNIGSISGELGGWRDAVYSATKGAVMSFTRGLALELAGDGVRVNAVLPGNIMTEARAHAVARSARPGAFHEYLERWQWMARSGTPEEVGNAVLFLASSMSSFCTGIGLVVSGGLELGFGVKEPYPDFGSDVMADP